MTAAPAPGTLAVARFEVPRPWWWDGALAGGYVVLGLATTLVWPVVIASDVPRGPAPARLVVVAALCLADLLRTRRPGSALLVAVPLAVGDVALGGSIPGALILADLLYCAVLHGSPRTSRTARNGGVALWVAGLLTVALLTGSPAAVAGTALTSAAILVLPVAWAREVRRPTEEAAAEREAAARAVHLAELDRRAAVADERVRIARDLHDSIAGHLSAIALQSQAALGAGEETREQVLHAVRENSVRSLEEMRVLIEVLRRTGAVDGGGGSVDAAPAASRLADLPVLLDSARAAGLEVRDRVDVPDGLPAAVDLTAYRILQEALTNAASHAPGAAVCLRLGVEEGELVLDVENPRPDATRTSAGTGTGVEGMRVRADAVGGHLEAGPVGERWRVHGRLPIGEAR